MKGRIDNIEIAAKSSFIVASEFEKITDVWDISKGEKICRFNSTYGFGGERIAISTDGKYIVTGSYRKKGLVLYHTSDGSIVWIRSDISKIQKVKFSIDNMYIFVSIDNKNILKISINDGSTLEKIKGAANIFFNLYEDVYLLESKEYIIYLNGRKASRICKESFACLDACFSNITVYISEAAKSISSIDFAKNQFNKLDVIPAFASIRAINYKNEEEIWRFKPCVDSHFLKVKYNKNKNVLFSILRIFENGGNRFLYVFNALTGELIDTAPLETGFYINKFDDYGNLLVSSDGYKIIIYHLDNDLNNMEKKELDVIFE